MCQKWEGDCGLWDLHETIRKMCTESLKKIAGAVWELPANPAHFHPSLAGLAVLFSRQLPNGSHNFFQTFSIFSKDYFNRNPQTIIALPFLTHNISAIGGVHDSHQQANISASQLDSFLVICFVTSFWRVF